MDVYNIDQLLITAGTIPKQLDLDRPVDPELVEECIEIAIQAPTSANQQNWHFVVVTDPAKRTAIAEIYRKAVRSELGDLDSYRQNGLSPQLECARYLAEHLHRIPLLIFPSIRWRAEKDAGVYIQADLYGSILPAAWSLMLALRARGLGAIWTTCHLLYEDEVAQILGIPEHVTQTVMLPVAYFTGDNGRIRTRRPGRAVTSWNGWKRERLQA